MKHKIILLLLATAFACSGSGNSKGNGNSDAFDIHTVSPDFGSMDQGPVVGCTSDKQCPAEKRKCEPVLHQCVQCINDGDCPQGYCVDNQCLDKPCKPNTRTCSRTGKARICNADGSKYTEVDCLAKGQECYQGQCVTCVPGELACKNNIAMQCKQDASGWNETPCFDKKCVDGKCLTCVPGARKCKGEIVMQCNADGTGYVQYEDCKSSETGKICHIGQCINMCKANAKFTTNLGCEYWPVDLEQPPKEANDNMDPENSPFAVVVGNTSKSVTAKITVYKAGQKFKEVTAPPGKATIINLPPYNVHGSMLDTRSWRIVSNLPVVAYQFNPLENVNVYSNDASMLMPTNALGREYMVVAYPQPKWAGVSAYLTVVGTSKQDTTVKITPTTQIQAGQGVQAMNPGQTYQFKLKQYQVLNLNTSQPFGDLTGTIITADRAVAVYAGDMCDTVPIETCDHGRCTYEKNFISCQTSNDCQPVMACDHLEQQIFPMKAVGKEYVITKSWKRGQAPDLVRVVAVQNNTRVQVSPLAASIPILNKGQHFDFEIMSDIHLTSNNPIMVAQFLEGQDAPGAAHMGCYNSLSGTPCQGGGGCTCAGQGKSCSSDSDCSLGDFPGATMVQCIDKSTQMSCMYGGNCVCLAMGGSCSNEYDCSPNDADIGDPAFILGVPVEQYRKKYVFLVPTKYADNYLNIVAKQGATVTLDGMTLAQNQFKPIQGSQYMSAKRKMQEGSHTITSNQPMGIVVYGWDWYVSYGYPGGMNIESIYSH